MKLTRFYENGAIVPGVFVSEDEILNCADFGEDWGEAFFENKSRQTFQKLTPKFI